MKAIVYSSVPASGKTTLIKNVIKDLGGINSFNFIEEGLVKYHKHKEKPIIVFGVFNDFEDTFVSTDKWSMAVQPILIDWIKKNKDLEVTCLGEGDRIYTKDILETFLKELGSDNFRLAMLKVSKQELTRRHIERKDDQDEKFLRSRETKYRNIDDYFNNVEKWKNETLEDSEKNKNFILSLLDNWKKSELTITTKEETFF